MTTLHIEHAITDFGTWETAFARFQEARTRAGVRRQVVRRPVDDPAYVVVDLEFDSSAEATRFRDFLVSEVWSKAANSPALVGAPQAHVLDVVSDVASEGVSR